ncbi:hypothetical protein [Klebsiella oxytoca]|nr:hypothetical protein [Klebsiella oxytoca]EJM1003325.1 hypothetical protein [Klebsiella oxytoca]EKQ7242182.1 hypothetical protein [Klebsiella oxytoca]WBD78744.1 hypothetical protein OEE41_06670 [Klebsiella oxytoca]HBC8619485.1 hypothetical protein [Klebsiella oxytoca]
MSLLTGIAIGALAVCIWQVIQLSRRVERLEDIQNKASELQVSQSPTPST